MEIQTLEPTTISTVSRRVERVRELMRDAMTGPTQANPAGVHYGPPFPGSTKLTLLKPGAELILALWQARAEVVVTESDLGNDHRNFTADVKIVHMESGVLLATGSGTCSTLESKYRYRNAERICPACGQATIFKSKHGDGWYCWLKRGGCGAQFAADDPQITGQTLGQVENANPADNWNTCCQMAIKRAVVSTCTRLPGVGDLFTSGGEDESTQDS